MTLKTRITTDGIVYRKKAYKNALAIYLILLGITVYAGGMAGLGRYLLASVGGNVYAVQGIGLILFVWGIGSLFFSAKPIYVWITIIAYLIYAVMSIIGASSIPNATPSAILQFLVPLWQTFWYVWERTHD